MIDIFNVIKDRGFIQQLTHELPLRELLSKESVAFYAGFDPTADSLHVGHMLPIMLMAHLQRAGHKPIAIVGGGTAMIGDPTGKTELRQMLTREQIVLNSKAIGQQISRFLGGADNFRLVDNAEWILQQNYIDFLREIGVHFSVNQMLTAECFRQRLERGLTFIEFNYMLLQGFDYLILNQRYGCRLQVGGDDQWSNILAGIDLIRRKQRVEAYGLTVPLITTSSGKKMGKTEAGAVWLSAERTTPYDFYQYWRNVEDADVKRFLAFYTFLPMEEVNRLGALKDKEINDAKKALAYEVTRLVHGETAANAAAEAARALFEEGTAKGSIPTTFLSDAEFSQGIPLLDLLVRTGLVASKGEGRRLITQNGLTLNDEKIDDPMMKIDKTHLKNEIVEFKKGKKHFHHVRIG